MGGEEGQETAAKPLSPSLSHRLFTLSHSLSLPFAQSHNRTLSLPPFRIEPQSHTLSPSLPPTSLSLNLSLPTFRTESQLHTLSPSLPLALSLPLSLSLSLSLPRYLSVSSLSLNHYYPQIFYESLSLINDSM